MSQQSGDRLYNLLPAIYRQRDETVGQPLRALLAVIEKEFVTLETDIAATYDNWFIETCDAWVIPYLADLVGIEDLADLEWPIFGQRRRVANHVAYKRRKGLGTILAHVARDVSGWHAYVTESSHRVAHTQVVKNVQLARGKTVDTRRAEQLALLGTAFDSITRTVDVRRIDADTQSGSQAGMASLHALGLYLWRLQTYPIRQAQAGVQAWIRRGKNTRHFTFDPLGQDLKLFIQPEAIDDLNEPMRPAHFPQPLTRQMLAADLAEAVSASKRMDDSSSPEQKTSRYYGPQQEIAIWITGRFVPAQELLSGRLSIGSTAYWDTIIQNLGAQGEEKSIVVDPENGRILLAKAAARDDVIVSYTYGFSKDLGSGPYRRDMGEAADKSARDAALRIDIMKAIAEASEDEIDLAERLDHIKKSTPPWRPITLSSLEQALDLWRLHCEQLEANQQPQAVIRFLDSGTYHLQGPLPIRMPSGSFLSIEAAASERPTIITEIAEKEEEIYPLGRPPEKERVVFDRLLRLQGLFVDGPIAMLDLNGGKLDFRINGCTLRGDLDLAIKETVLFNLAISNSILDSIDIEIGNFDQGLVDNRNGSLVIEDSIIAGDVTTRNSSELPYELDVSLVRSTVLGKARLSRVLQIENSILLGGMYVELENNQMVDPNSEHAVMRYSYAAETNLKETMLEHCVIGPRLRPLFTSTQTTHPGYGQLRNACPKEIRYGASNGAEMGVFNSLHVNRREANLERMLPHYLPLGHALGIFTVT